MDFSNFEDGTSIKFLKIRSEKNLRFLEMTIKTCRYKEMLNEGETADDVDFCGAFIKISDSELMLIQNLSVELGGRMSYSDLEYVKNILPKGWKVTLCKALWMCQSKLLIATKA